MGGFVGKDDSPLTTADFFVLRVRGLDVLEGRICGDIRSDPDISPILSVTKEELMDKSKGDALSKSISLLQTTWFVVQYFSPKNPLSSDDPTGNCHASLRPSEFL